MSKPNFYSLLTLNADGATESRRSSYFGGMSISGFSFWALPRIPANGAISSVAHDYLLSPYFLSSKAITIITSRDQGLCIGPLAVNHGIVAAWKTYYFSIVEIFMGLAVG